MEATPRELSEEAAERARETESARSRRRSFLEKYPERGRRREASVTKNQMREKKKRKRKKTLRNIQRREVASVTKNE